MEIRKMTEADIPEVLALQQELAFQSWNEKEFTAEIRANYAHCVVCVSTEDAKLLGYAVFHLMGPDSELLSIATRESSQRSGIGTSLLDSGLSKLNEPDDCCFLEVRDGNMKARSFYEKHGFKQYSIRKKYYADGEDAILYKKKMDSQEN